MQLKVIGSSSKGNAYILEASDGEVLLIECGVRFEEIKKALEFKLNRVAGCIITHEHKDHCKSVCEVLAHGIKVWASVGTHAEMQTTEHHRSNIAISGQTFKCGNYSIKPFDTKHDCAQPVGYLIYHQECGSVLFLTDSYYCEYRFTGLNNIIIEANYCQSILDQRVTDGANPKFLRDRVITSHMSLATCKDALQSYDISAVNQIVLIHLSDGNSDSNRFQREVTEVTGKPVHIAEAGLIIAFNKTPF